MKKNEQLNLAFFRSALESLQGGLFPIGEYRKSEKIKLGYYSED